MLLAWKRFLLSCTICFCHFRPLKNSDISLMDDNQNEWGEDEPVDTKRFRVSQKRIA